MIKYHRIQHVISKNMIPVVIRTVRTYGIVEIWFEIRDCLEYTYFLIEEKIGIEIHCKVEDRIY